MKFGRRKRSDSESSYCIDMPTTSKSPVSKTRIQRSEKKGGRQSKRGRSSTPNSASAKSPKVQKVNKTLQRDYDGDDIENFLDESEVESYDEDESAPKRIKIDPKNGKSNSAEKNKSSANRSGISESDEQDSDQSPVEASNFYSTKLNKPGPASSKKQFQVAKKQFHQTEREHGSSIEAGKKSRPGPASKKPGYRPTKADSRQESETNQSDRDESSDNETSDSGEVIFNRRAFNINLPSVLVYILVNCLFITFWSILLLNLQPFFIYVCSSDVVVVHS